MYIPFVTLARKSYALLRPHDLEEKNDENMLEERRIQDHHIKCPNLLALFWTMLLTVIVGGSLGLFIGWHLPRKLQADAFLDGLLRKHSHTTDILTRPSNCADM